MSEANKSLMLSEAEIIEAINSDSLISVSLGAGQPQKNVKMSTLATVAAGLLPFQKVESLPAISNANWYLLGWVGNQCASVFLYVDVTFVNTLPALYAVAVYNYESNFTVKCRLLVGNTGGTYDPNIKYKLENGVVKF